MSDPSNARAGSYPAADDANMFGEAWRQFQTDYRQAMLDDTYLDMAKASFYFLLEWGLPRAAAQEAFQATYKQLLEDEDGNAMDPSLASMRRVAGALKQAWHAAGMWDYRSIPEDNEPIVIAKP